MNHGEVAEAARNWLHVPFVRVAMKEIGLPSGRRIDVLAYEPRGNVFRLVECKASLADLKNAPRQLEGYRCWADLLYVAVPEELESAAKELLPKKVGLLVIRRHANAYAADHGYLSTRSARNPRRVPMADRERGAMATRALTWLLAHFEATRVCKACGHEVPHGPA